MASDCFPIALNLLNTPQSLFTSQQPDALLWHRRLGHPGKQAVKLVTGLDFASESPCTPCLTAKTTLLPSHKVSSNTKTSHRLELVQADVITFSDISNGGYKYLTVFVDRHTSLTTVYLTKTKAQVKEHVSDYIRFMQNTTGEKIKRLLFDGGTEFINSSVKQLLVDYGIALETAMPYTHTQNGIVERKNRFLEEKTHALLKDARLPNSFWDQASLTACYLINRLPHSTSSTTPWEKFFDETVDISRLRVFGCLCYTQVPRVLRGKLDDTSTACILLGYEPLGYRL
jgi:hypothetical protein